MGVLAMSGLTSLIWQRSSQSNLCDQIAPGTDQLENSYTRSILNNGIVSVAQDCLYHQDVMQMLHHAMQCNATLAL